MKENRWAYNSYYVTTETKKKCVRFESRRYDFNLKPFCQTIFLLLFTKFDNILNYVPSLASQRFTNEKSQSTGCGNDCSCEVTIMSRLTVLTTTVLHFGRLQTQQYDNISRNNSSDSVLRPCLALTEHFRNISQPYIYLKAKYRIYRVEMKVFNFFWCCKDCGRLHTCLDIGNSLDSIFCYCEVASLLDHRFTLAVHS